MNNDIEDKSLLYLAYGVVAAFLGIFVFMIKDLSRETWSDIIRAIFSVMGIVLAAFALIWAINTIIASL